MKKIDPGWNIDNSYERLPQIFFSKVEANPVSRPKLLVLNNSLAEELGLDGEILREKIWIDLLSGNKSLNNKGFLAQAYGGHQFGHFTMLGDGRAMLIGEQITPSGQRMDIQLKGSGKTPYSRGGDGRAGLGQMLREYIISEAMYYLRIPTSRSLAIVTTGDPVYREKILKGSVLTRISKSHIRVGSFEYAARWGNFEELKALADYTIQRHFSNIKNHENPYLSLLRQVIKVQASLIANWNLVGFIHGVMNTDNMTISGETIDYGPCAFMDQYGLDKVFSSIDRNGRYAYGNQGNIGGWNLARFAESLLPLIHKDQVKAVQMAEEAVNNYFNIFDINWLNGMRLKLGIINKEDEDDKILIDQLLHLMEKYKADFTNTFVSLTLDEDNESDLFQSQDFKEWKRKWILKLKEQEIPIEVARDNMKKVNPLVIPRNHQVEKALDWAVEKNDLTVFEDLLQVLSKCFDYNSINREYMSPPEKTSIPYKTYCGT